MENGESFEEDHHGYASGSSNHRDRPSHHSGRREKAMRDDSLRENIQGKHGMYFNNADNLENDWQFLRPT